MTPLGRVLCGVLLASAPVVAQAVPSQQPDPRVQAAEGALEKNDFRTAANLLSKLAVERPNDTHVLYDLGYAEDHLDDTAGATRAYTAAIAADPSYGEAHVALGLLLARTGAGSEAEVEAQLRAGASNTATPAAVRGHALRALATIEEPRHPAQAADDLLKAVQLTQETETDIAQSADIASASGNFADAEKAYRRALEQKPDDIFASTGLGQVLQRENKLGEADQVLSALLPKHPDNPDVLAMLATVKARENKFLEAVALLEPLVSAGSATSNPGLARELARLYGMAGQLPKAEALYGDLVRAEPNDAELLDAYGDVLVREAKFPQAQAILQRAVANRAAWPHPADWAEAAGHLAFAASRNHDPQTTLQALAARATVLPNSPASLFLQATAHDTLHRNKEAVQEYQAFLQIANGKFPDEEFEARHRVIALQHMK